MASDPNRVGGIDPAALAAATLSATISAIAPAGPYGPIGMIVGATMFVLIWAYDVDPNRTRLQSFAFGAVCGLILLLTIGYPLEILSANDPGTRFSAILREPASDIQSSEVRPIVAILFWLAATLAICWFDQRRLRRSAKTREPAISAGS
jgi:hypothetical protein